MGIRFREVTYLDSFINKLIEIGTQAGGKIILALLVFFIGRIVIKKVLKIISKMKSFEKIDPTAHSFILNILSALLNIFLVIAIISILGVPMTSVVAVLASCALAVGMAMQGALSNLAGGLMLLIFRPFNEGDYIVAGGSEGVVKNISRIYTILNTVDNKTVSIPNGSLMNGNIENLSKEPTRRVDLSFNVSGEHAIEDVRALMLKVVSENAKVLQDPAPQIEPLAPVSGGLTYTVRAWTETANYWDVYFDLMRAMPPALGAAGFGGPASTVKVKEVK